MKVFLLLVGLLLVGSQAHAAALDLSTVTFDISVIQTYAIAILTALAAMWMIRKAVKTTNKS